MSSHLLLPGRRHPKLFRVGTLKLKHSAIEFWENRSLEARGMGNMYTGGRGRRQAAVGTAKLNFLQAPPQAGATWEQVKRAAEGGPSTPRIVFKFCCGPGFPCMSSGHHNSSPPPRLATEDFRIHPCPPPLSGSSGLWSRAIACGKAGLTVLFHGKGVRDPMAEALGAKDWLPQGSENYAHSHTHLLEENPPKKETQEYPQESSQMPCSAKSQVQNKCSINAC